MKLKSLEVIGFKSFANKTKINFNNGLTEIVGPNGSGKSNVIEAIRWVLGEQSAKTLRGTKMPDIIFSGSVDHKALNRAEVKLTLDNTDQYINSPYSEIIIARKLFRNGDSQYFINKQECRLKDINNLFMDTGMGLGSFSIISQGNIEKIFNSKPEDRRSIIETAAGVFKYKHQKHDANLKLKQTKDNLDRVEDIIYELKSRNDSLKEQSNLAKKYLEKKDQLEKLDINKLVFELKDFISKKDVNNKELVSFKNKKDILNNEISKYSKEANNQKNELEKNLNLKEKLQNQLLKSSQQLERISGEQNLSKQDLEFKKKSIIDKKGNLKKLIIQKKNLLNNSSSYKKEIDQLSAKFTELNNKVQASNLNLLNKELSSKRNFQEELKSNYLDIMQKMADLNNKNIYLDKNKKQSDVQNISQKNKIREIKNDVAEFNSKISSFSEMIGQSKESYSKIDNKYMQYKKKLSELNSIIQKNKADWYHSLEEYQNIKIKYNSLKKITDDHSNFYRGAKNILADKKQLSGVYGSVSDYLKVSSKYSLAIETALGSQLQQIIVQDSNSAKNAINYLNQNKLGRATFVPVESVSKRFITNQKIDTCKNYEGFIGTADSLVDIDKELLIIKKHLLGNVIISKDLDSATAISRAINYSNRVITLDGEIINSGGSMTGGKNKNHYDGMLSQKNKLTDLSKKMDSFSILLKNQEKTINENNEKFINLSDEVKSLEDKMNSLSTKISNYRNNKEFNEKIISQKKRELKSIRMSINDIFDDDYEEQIQNNNQIKNKLNQDLLKNQSASKNTNERIITLESLISSLNDDLNSNKSKLAVIKEKINNYRNKNADVIESIDQLDNDIQLTNDSIDSLDEDLKLIISNSTSKEKINNLKQQIKSNKLELNKCNQLIVNLQTKISNLDSMLEEKRENYIIVTSSYNKFSTNDNQIDNGIIKLKEKLSSKYNIDTKNVNNFKINESYNDIKKSIGLLNEQINALGNINISSIDEYKEVSKRYQFLINQSEDLKNSSNQLTETMNKIDSTVKYKFKDTFDKVAVQFKDVYTEIFGGGKAKLVLTNPNNLLTTGIEIMAQPPGKKYRHMSLLSGGEKALTAISLLFAVLKVKPVPFCILDEAESALDAENVDRYAKYMSNLDTNTQFIVITHRKETMMYADTLYGVTMQDSGVSEVVSANLNKFNSMED
ncbi:chromosome segregation protein SMC [Apilactobacillus apisilvae]|uniref:Chromosome partition protein Smc n=1 Tax=Apilactobacillus apisilvae TaxID=2923364 RepID=A0ABY4PHQ6_9LACO|nr:chromosome segregation protein SMC [Apilactobacillus apisilvae]UQS85339.1 chromosome segregation protein SMC [Apilactobacillus apisilvae]